LTEALTQARDDFINWDADRVPGPNPHELDIIGQAYHSAAPDVATQSLVLTIGNDAGIHPLTTYRSLNYDVEKHAPITIDTLFKPGTAPLGVLNPIVQRAVDAHGGDESSLNAVGIPAYRSFALTDDAVIFFFDQDGLLPHTSGPLTVTVPRTDIAPLLA
jgi:uncharacterized protein DUF3298